MELTSIIILESHQPGLFFHVVLKFNLLQQAAGFGAQYDESDWDGITRSSRIAVVQVNAWKIGGNMQDIISISDKILQKTTFRNRPQMLVATSTLFLSPYCWFCRKHWTPFFGFIFTHLECSRKKSSGLLDETSFVVKGIFWNRPMSSWTILDHAQNRRFRISAAGSANPIPATWETSAWPLISSHWLSETSEAKIINIFRSPLRLKLEEKILLLGDSDMLLVVQCFVFLLKDSVKKDKFLRKFF